MQTKIAVIADTHYSFSELEQCGVRRSAIADILLQRAVHRLNRFIKPDVTLIVGDLIDYGAGPCAIEELKQLKQTVDLLESPVIVIPGNHDGDIEAFYSVFERPDEVVDIGEARLVTFLDPEEMGFNARRTAADLKRMEAAREGHAGPLVSLQHVPLFAPGTSSSPYRLTNAEEAWDVFEKAGYTLAISGHYHPGDDLVGRQAGRALIAPALCESPFAFMEVTIDGDKVETRRHELRMPLELELVDYHAHTPFAYCGEDLDTRLSIALAQEMGLAGLVFTEHSGQLYFDRKTFWAAAFMQDGLATTEGALYRMADYFERTTPFCPPAYLGFEIDCDYEGNPVIRPEDMARAQVRVGSIHWLASLRREEPDIEAAGEEMLARLSRFLPCGIQILAHPYRVFKKNPAPEWLGPRLVDLLREHGVAAEANFHTQETSPEFVKLCVEGGVKLVFGGDSHRLYEVGEFWPHVELMRRCGYANSDLRELIADFRPERERCAC